MFTKLYAEIKKIIRENWKMICLFLLLSGIALFPLPYYIDTPGGAIDISKKIKMEEKQDAKGSLNFAYVTELKATTVTYFLSFFNKEWEVLKKSDVTYDNETIKDMEFRDKLLLEESNDNAILVAYQKLGKKVSIESEHTFITYIDEEANTDLMVGDEVLTLNGEKIKNKDDFLSKIRKHNIGDTIHLTVKDGNKERKATLIDNNGVPMIGVSVNTDTDLETDPKISIQKEENESGPSGGLMLSLAIYNSLTKEDITHGKKIVGTGTIDREGNVGSIGGVSFKLKGAVKEKADIFLVPAGDNYEDAIQLKKKNKYDIEIKAIKTFEEALTYLKSL